MSEQQQQSEVKIPSSEELLKPETKEEVVIATPQLTEEEVRASEDGWVPKKDWKGNPDDWRPAKEFNERGELFSRIKAQSHELAELKKAMTFLTNQQQKQFEAGYTQAINNLKSAREAALQEGDMVKAQRITDKIDEVKDQHAKQVTQQVKIPQEPSETFKAWHSKNKWYTADKVLTRMADAYGQDYRDQYGSNGTEAGMLEFVEKSLRKEFPHKFNISKGPPSPDSEGRGNSPRGQQGASDNLREIEEGMNEMQRGIMKTILKTTKMTKEQYLKQYAGV